MSNQNDKVFAKGIYFFSNPQQPEWVVGTLSINVEDAVQFLQENKNAEGKIKLGIKKSQSGKFYLDLDTFQSPNQGQAQADKPVHEQMNPDISKASNPFDNNTKSEPFADRDEFLPF